MSDPFSDRSNKQLYREAQLWMAVFTCLMAVFLYLVVKRMSGSGDRIPEHVLQAGVAQVVTAQGDSSNALHGGFPDVQRPRSSRPSFDRFRPRETELVGLPNIDLETRSDQRERKLDHTLGDRKPIQSMADRQNHLAAASNSNVFEFENVESNSNVESKGERRARELAKITKDLPKRLEGMRSAVRQATAILPEDNSGAVSRSIALGAALNAQPTAVSQDLVTRDRNLSGKKTMIGEKAMSGEKTMIDKKTSNEFELPEPSQILHAKPAAKPNLRRLVDPSTENAEGLVVAAETKVRSVSSNEPTLAASPSKSKLSPERSLPVVVMENGNQFPQTHRVQWGDSFFSVAQEHYRDGRWFHALYLANKDKVQDFDLLPKGTMLLIPSPERLAERFPKFAVPEPLDKQSLDSAANRIYETKANDTLFDISRRKLGQGSRYLEIIKQNESRLPRSIGASEVLPANLRLVLPVSSVQ